MISCFGVFFFDVGCSSDEAIDESISSIVPSLDDSGRERCVRGRRSAGDRDFECGRLTEVTGRRCRDEDCEGDDARLFL